MDKYNLLYDLQHGFRSKRSCETQPVTLIEDLMRNSIAGNQTDLVLLDFSKAFEKVSHQELLLKLYRNGIRGPTGNDLLTGKRRKLPENAGKRWKTP